MRRHHRSRRLRIRRARGRSPPPRASADAPWPPSVISTAPRRTRAQSTRPSASPPPSPPSIAHVPGEGSRTSRRSQTPHSSLGRSGRSPLPAAPHPPPPSSPLRWPGKIPNVSKVAPFSRPLPFPSALTCNRLQFGGHLQSSLCRPAHRRREEEEEGLLRRSGLAWRRKPSPPRTGASTQPWRPYTM